MWYAVYEVWDRFWWYGVPAVCEHPWCKKVIDRWMWCACWWMPFSDHGCDRYFCEKHLRYVMYNKNWTILSDDATDEEYDNATSVNLCKRCRDNKDPFPYKPEHKKWVKHILNDESWEEWRWNNPEKVKELQLLLS